MLGVKLKYLDGWTTDRRRVAHRYHELLADTPLQLPTEADYAESAYHLYVVRHPQRDDLKKHLETNKVGCALHYPLSLHLQKCYANLGYKAGDFPVAEKAARLKSESSMMGSVRRRARAGVSPAPTIYKSAGSLCCMLGAGLAPALALSA